MRGIIPAPYRPAVIVTVFAAMLLPYLVCGWLVTEARADTARANARTGIVLVRLARLQAASEESATVAAKRLAQVEGSLAKAQAEVKAVREDNAQLVAVASRAAKRGTPTPRAIPPTTTRRKKYEHNMPSLIRIVASKHGITGKEADALVELARRESTFRPTATNGSCMGLFQLKTTDARWSDPAWNTAQAIGYIRSRYGTPSAAIAHHNAHHWY